MSLVSPPSSNGWTIPLSHFLRICILLVLTNTHICTQWPQNFLVLFDIWVFQIRKILCWFQICGNNWKKVHPEKVRSQILLQVSSIEEKLRFFTLFLAITFLLANFSHFSKQFWNQRKILRCFDTHIHILQRKSFYVIIALFQNFKARFARNSSKFWKTLKSLYPTTHTWLDFIKSMEPNISCLHGLL